MKKILSIISIAVAAFALDSCDLDLYSPTSFNKGNIEEHGESEVQFSTRSDMLGLRNTMYNSWLKDLQEMGLEDWLVYSETRSDNAYCGTTTPEIMALEANTQDGSNVNVKRDWDWYQTQVSNANNIICNIDEIRKMDSTLSESECRQWKAEALIWRAFCFFRLTQLWGDAPMVLEIPPAITVDNVEEYYHLYYPDRVPRDQVYARLVEDLTLAAQDAPDVDAGNKMLLSKAFAKGLLARIYAEKPIRDWNKVIEYCNDIEGMGFKLEENYDDLWAYTPFSNDAEKGASDAHRNSKETIMEVQWTNKNEGNWVFMMYHRNAYDPDNSYSWAKWTTPSRDLIAAFEAEGDEVRYKASVVWDSCNWSNYYPSDNYAFAHKMRTNVSSIILMRLGEIYLLHAEALACTGKLAEAAEYVNRIRNRAGLAPIATPSDEKTAIDLILKERRLELAFEGFRFFDLARHDRIIDVHNSAELAKDSYWQRRSPLDENTILLPIPTTALESNSSLEQNPGY
ncbi:MAG: RagB/SusD family nutrient uptake outer membrane protein [Bacteroidales bacterium]|nr:RagB/SusD family nutrient uptake outer membrane protein [Bacteroidales bacterium]